MRKPMALVLITPSGGAKRVADALPEPSFALGRFDIVEFSKKSMNARRAVTSVAMALGYDNPAAFAAMFQRALRPPPRLSAATPRLSDAAPPSRGR